jgi:oligopeptidase A
VLAGLFKIVETLFEVAIRRDRRRCGTRVEFYRIERGTATLVGQFYLDPARAHRQARRRLDGRRARPLAAPRHRPAADARGPSGVQLRRRRGWQAALLTHDDVITLFHEFGHGLHHMLTQVNERDVSGISGVEWDAVELPSQFMENFCWEWDVLRT